MKVKVTWLSPAKFPVGFEFRNVYGRVIGKVLTTAPLGGKYHRVEAELDEDLPLEIVLTSNPFKVKNG